MKTAWKLFPPYIRCDNCAQETLLSASTYDAITTADHHHIHTAFFRSHTILFYKIVIEILNL